MDPKTYLESFCMYISLRGINFMSTRFIFRSIIIFILSLLCSFAAVKQYQILSEQHPHWNNETKIINYLASDLQYFPLVSAVSKGVITEFQTKESLGKKLISFPFVSVAPIAFFTSIFGEDGWVLSRFFIYNLYFIAFFLISMIVLDNFVLACCFALLYYSSSFNFFNFVAEWIANKL